MIDHAFSAWKKEWVDFIFYRATVGHILAIPLPLQGGDDVLMWPDDDGNYNLKLGYSFVRKNLFGSVSSSSTQPSLPVVHWKKLWRKSSQPRCKAGAWRVVSHLLPVRDSLWRKGLDVDPLCHLCESDVETVHHLFLTCFIAQSFRFGSPLSLRVEQFRLLSVFLSEFLDWPDDDVVEVW